MKKLKLINLAKQKLNSSEMNSICGGTAPQCGCGCLYSELGGSTTLSNGLANWSGGLFSRDCVLTINQTATIPGTNEKIERLFGL